MKYGGGRNARLGSNKTREYRRNEEEGGDDGMERAKGFDARVLASENVLAKGQRRALRTAFSPGSLSAHVHLILHPPASCSLNSANSQISSLKRASFPHSFYFSILFKLRPDTPKSLMELNLSQDTACRGRNYSGASRPKAYKD